MKKRLMFLVPVLGAVSTFAQEGAGGSSAQTMFTEAQGVINDVHAQLVPFLIAAFGIAVAFVAYKLAKRALNKA